MNTITPSRQTEIKELENNVTQLWEDFLDAVAVLEVMKNENIANDVSHDEMKKELGL